MTDLQLVMWINGGRVDNFAILWIIIIQSVKESNA